MPSQSPIERLLIQSRDKLDGISGLVLAGTDGLPVAHSLAPESVNSTAAVSASSVQLARRLADLLGDGDLEEITVRSKDGYVIVNAVGDRWVLTALTERSANVARINLAFRDLVPQLVDKLSNQS